MDSNIYTVAEVPNVLQFCPSCKKYVSDMTESYCPDCGTHLVSQPAFTSPQNPAGTVGATSSVSSQLSKLSPTAKLVLGIVVIVIIIVGVAAALGNNHSPQPSSPNPGNGSGGGGAYAVEVTQSGVRCDGLTATWRLSYGVGSDQQLTTGCGNSQPFAVTTSSSTDCIDAVVWVEAGGASGSGLSTTVAIVQNGNVKSSFTSQNPTAQLTVVWPNGC